MFDLSSDFDEMRRLTRLKISTEDVDFWLLDRIEDPLDT